MKVFLTSFCLLFSNFLGWSQESELNGDNEALSKDSSTVHPPALSNSFMLAGEYYFSGGGGILAEYSWKRKYALELGSHFLLTHNYWSWNNTLGLSPVSVHWESQFAIEPIAFFRTEYTIHVGTGWELGPFVGIGLNKGADKATHNVNALVIKNRLAGIFQMESAAFTDNPWANVQFQGKFSIIHNLYTKAEAMEPWIYQDDGGENLNGFQRELVIFSGWHMPISETFQVTPGWLVKNKKLISEQGRSPMNDQGQIGWGSDFTNWWYGPVLLIEFSKGRELVTLWQWRKQRKYIETDDDESLFLYKHYQGPETINYRVQLIYEQSL